MYLILFREVATAIRIGPDHILVGDPAELALEVMKLLADRELVLHANRQETELLTMSNNLLVRGFPPQSEDAHPNRDHALPLAQKKAGNIKYKKN